MYPFQNPNAARRIRQGAALPAVALFLLLMPVATSAQGITGTIRGTVTNQDTGEPMVTVTVGLFKADGTPTMVGAYTDRQGEYVILNVPPGRYELHAMRSGYRTLVVQDVLVTVGLATRQDFQLRTSAMTGSIRGSVTEVASGNPIAAVNVVLFNTDGTATPLGAFTDDDGNYVIINVPEGRYILRAAMVRFKTVEVQNLLVTPGVTTRQNFQLEKMPSGR